METIKKKDLTDKERRYLNDEGNLDLAAMLKAGEAAASIEWLSVTIDGRNQRVYVWDANLDFTNDRKENMVVDKEVRLNIPLTPYVVFAKLTGGMDLLTKTAQVNADNITVINLLDPGVLPKVCDITDYQFRIQY